MNIVNYQIESQFFNLQKAICFNKGKEIVFVCVGNYKIWYDSFAPCFAETLRKTNINCYVYGGENSIVPDNLLEYMSFIERVHAGALIIVVDNCIVDGVGDGCNMYIKSRPVIPAEMIQNNAFGDISIIYSVCRKGDRQYYLKSQKFAIEYLVNKIESCLHDILYKKSLIQHKFTK